MVVVLHSPSDGATVLPEAENQRVDAVRNLIGQLPPANFDLLRRLVEHLGLYVARVTFSRPGLTRMRASVSKHSEANSMSIHNLAVIFAPTLLQPEKSPTSFAQSMGNLGHASSLVVMLVTQAEKIFQAAPMVDAQGAPVEESKGVIEQEQTGKDVDEKPEAKPDTAAPPRAAADDNQASPRIEGRPLQRVSSSPPASAFFERLDVRCSDDAVGTDRPLSFHSALSAH
jgi:hypothetical protein